MSYKVQQHRISSGGRTFHFVSYAGEPANARKGEPATGPMWYMMRAGRRWSVMPQVLGEPESETLKALAEWIKSQNLGEG